VKPRAPTCPQCGKEAGTGDDARWRPFCSERCKLADLGGWFSGRYSIPADGEPEPPAAPPDQEPRQ
jgi:endogenous inhibitor of DNA gyrase (YacG/DUF329 family)